MVVPKKALSYDEERSKRMADNQKKLQELKIGQLSQALSKSIAPKPSPMKKNKAKPRVPVDLTAVRRSSRVADMPPTSYREVPIEGLGKSRRSGGNTRDLSDRVYASEEDRETATERANELQSGLAPDIPSIVKPMTQSHVTGGFWLGLPVHFCRKYMPKRDEMITLVNEKGKEFETNYLALKPGLSGGWRRFAIEHDLVDGDACVFQLVKPTRFKVYIIRVNED